jgi:hypothetical protein
MENKPSHQEKKVREATNMEVAEKTSLNNMLDSTMRLSSSDKKLCSKPSGAATTSWQPS